MRPDLEPRLRQAAATTFEQLGFLWPETELTDEQAAASPTATASVTFSGPLEGLLLIDLYGDVLPELAANMMGAAEAPDTGLQDDALGEVTNVVCGNVLPSLAGDEAVFRLGAPSVSRSSGPGEPHGGEMGDVTLGLDGGRARIRIFVSGAAPGADP